MTQTNFDIDKILSNSSFKNGVHLLGTIIFGYILLRLLLLFLDATHIGSSWLQTHQNGGLTIIIFILIFLLLILDLAISMGRRHYNDEKYSIVEVGASYVKEKAAAFPSKLGDLVSNSKLTQEPETNIKYKDIIPITLSYGRRIMKSIDSLHCISVVDFKSKVNKDNAEIKIELLPPGEAPTLTEKLVNNQKILLMLPVMLIISAELLLFSGRMQYAICLHVLVLVGLTLATIYTCETGLFMPYQALMLLPILRLINISMPIFFETTLYSYIFIYTPLIIPVYIVAVQQGFTFGQLGFNMMYWKLIIPVSLIVGFVIAQGEYYIIRPGYMIPDLSFWNLLALSIVMILFIGLIEELIFRSILQTRLQESLGMFSGLIVTSMLFGVLHSGYGTFYEMLFTSLAGLAIGIMFQKTRSLPLIALTHGLVNVFLFGVIPLMGPTLGLF